MDGKKQREAEMKVKKDGRDKRRKEKKAILE